MSENSEESVSPAPESLDDASPDKQITPSTVKEEVDSTESLPETTQMENKVSSPINEKQPEPSDKTLVSDESLEPDESADESRMSNSSDESAENSSVSDESSEKSSASSESSSSEKSPVGSDGSKESSDEMEVTEKDIAENETRESNSTGINTAEKKSTESKSAESESAESKSEESKSAETSTAEKEVKSEESSPVAEQLDNATNKLAEKEAEQQESAAEETKSVDVAQFNDVMKMFLTGPLLQDETFNSLQPEQQEYVVLRAYEESTGIKPHISLNFGATTSYNKSRLRNSDRYQPPVPINPFCLRPDIRKPMSPGEKKAYYEYLEQEDKTNGGKFDGYPIGSRLFIGNLAVNTLKKEEVFRVFHPYGRIVQVNLKQGFGFIQYTNAESCSRAIRGESNVPLHNKFMHLEVSKHQIQKAIERQNVSRPSLRDERERTRERSPVRDSGRDYASGRDSERDSGRDYASGRDSGRDTSNRNTSNRRPGSPEVKILLTNSSSSGFNDRLVERLKSDGLEVEVETVESKVEDIPQEQVLDSAYSGVYAVISTCGSGVVNIMVFEKDDDGGIKFDEYTGVTIDAAMELVLAAKAKEFARSSGSVERGPGWLPASLPKVRPPRARSPYRRPVELPGGQPRRRRGGREREARYRGSREGTARYPEEYHQAGRGEVPYSSNYYPDQRRRVPSGGYYGMGEMGEIAPPHRISRMAQPHRITQNAQPQQPLPHPQSQGQPQGQFYNGYPQQAAYPNAAGGNSSVASALQSLQGMNPASMQTMLNLMQQMQQNNSTQQQILQMLQQFQNTPNAGSNQYMQPQMQPQQQQQQPQQPKFQPQHVAFNSPQYAQPHSQAPQHPQNTAESGNMLANLLGQLQYSAPGSASDPHNAQNNASFSNNDHASVSKDSKSKDQDQTGDLFETLARLKNNM
ncbi:hypothetical protein BRETT_004360 [Brettanomyces bruxellensis]|uniref:RRM domain-containing protein n=1 Tax=Dekkera bruxellensis TaxID=5007 RepID=A0A871R0S7_DEKBR|nr:uncharacterized protein BRETT_004360 [Brettanomyces bruxellensis]QOU19139.1 hypothetical protein BRETT_004360 [Brettanomyces bruxellensis]